MQNRARFELSALSRFGFAKRQRRAAASLFVAAWLAGATSLSAQFTWNPISGNNVSNASNWTEGLPGANATLNFGPASLAASVTLDASFSVNTINFSGPTLFGINTVNGSVLTITNAVTNSSTGSGTILIGVPVVLGGNVTVSGSSTTANLNVQNTLTGSGSLTLNLASGRTLLCAARPAPVSLRDHESLRVLSPLLRRR